MDESRFFMNAPIVPGPVGLSSRVQLPQYASLYWRRCIAHGHLQVKPKTLQVKANEEAEQIKAQHGNQEHQ